MFSIVILDASRAAPLAATLSALVPAAVEGVVRDVFVLDEGDDGVRSVADHAGCTMLPKTATLEAANRMKGAWILVLRSGAHLPANWLDAVLAYAAADPAGEKAGSFRAPCEGTTSFWKRWLAGERVIVVPRRLLVARGDAAWQLPFKGLPYRRLRVARNAR